MPLLLFRISLSYVLLLFGMSAWSQIPAATTNAGAAVLARSQDGLAVTASDVLADIQMRVPPNERQALLSRLDAVKQLASNLLVRRVLAAEAERDGLPKQPLIAALMNVALDRILSDARLAAFDAQNTPTEAALEVQARALYQAAGKRFETPAQHRVSHILIDNKGPDSLRAAQDILAQLRAGASFEALAKARSTDPGSAVKGGDLGFFGPGKMVRPFEDAANALVKPGDLSEPVLTQFGYHILRLDERRPASATTFDEVRAELMAEARTSILNHSRIEKVQVMSKGFSFESAAIESLVQPAAR